MAREFTRNMFISLLAIMIGAIIITFFVADIQARIDVTRTLTAEHQEEIESIESKNINFTSNYMKSTTILEQAREDRSWGNHHYELAWMWYKNALLEDNETDMNTLKSSGIDNCTKAMTYYKISNKNFKEATDRFILTKNYTNYYRYDDLIDIYINLTETGERLTMLRYNASNYLKMLTTNITFTMVNNVFTVIHNENISELFNLLNNTIFRIQIEEEQYLELLNLLDQFEFFDEIR